MLPTLLLQRDVHFILTDKLNQDPLEEHFGRQRSRLGGSDNTTLQQYGESELKLQVAKSGLITSIKGNSRGRKEERVDIHDMTPLPKKQKEN